MTTFTFDDTRIEITETHRVPFARPVGMASDEYENRVGVDGFRVTVTESAISLPLHTADGSDLYASALWNTAGMVRARSVDAWTADRIAFCFSLAARRITVSA